MSAADGWRNRLVVEDSKILDYLLDRDHPVGRPKALFFESIGFEKAAHTIFRRALLEHGRMGDLIETSIVRSIERYRVEGRIDAPRPSGLTVRTIWQDEGKVVRLVTAYPIGKDGR